MCDLEREIRLVLSGYVLLGQGPPLLAPIVSYFLALRSSRNHAPQAQDRDVKTYFTPVARRKKLLALNPSRYHHKAECAGRWGEPGATRLRSAKKAI